MSEQQAIEVGELDVVGSLFGMKLLNDGQVGLYIEDDGSYFYKLSFDKHWLLDLAATTSRLAYAIENELIKKD